MRSYLVGVVFVESLKVKNKTMDSQPVIYVESSKADGDASATMFAQPSARGRPAKSLWVLTPAGGRGGATSCAGDEPAFEEWEQVPVGSVTPPPIVGESAFVHLLENVMSAFSGLNVRLCDIQQQQSLVSAAVAHLTRAAAPDTGLTSTRVGAVVIQLPGQGERTVGEQRQSWCDPVAEAVELSDGESWSTPCASLIRDTGRGQGLVTMIGYAGRQLNKDSAANHRSSSRSTVAARGPDGDAPSSSDGEAGGSPAGRRRGRSSTRQQRNELVEVVPAGGSPARKRDGSPAQRLRSSLRLQSHWSRTNLGETVVINGLRGQRSRWFATRSTQSRGVQRGRRRRYALAECACTS